MLFYFNFSLTSPHSFSRTLINKRGAALGAEFRGKGVNVALGPDMLVADPHVPFLRTANCSISFSTSQEPCTNGCCWSELGRLVGPFFFSFSTGGDLLVCGKVPWRTLVVVPPTTSPLIMHTAVLTRISLEKLRELFVLTCRTVGQLMAPLVGLRPSLAYRVPVFNALQNTLLTSMSRNLFIHNMDLFDDHS